MTAYTGLRVLDFTSGVAGPMACGLLAQFGADVLKVEPPGGERTDNFARYCAWNCNKRRLELDLESPVGRREALKLIAVADVAVFDASPKTLRRLGFDYRKLRDGNPRLVHAWLPMYGTTGRWSELEPEDSLLSAASCLSFAQSSWEDVPVHLVTPQVSYGHGILAAGAIGAAILERDRSGLGQSVVCSGIHGAAAVRSGGAIRADNMIRMGSRGSRGLSPNYRLYCCADGEWLFLGTLTTPFFLRALEAMELLEMLALEGIDGEITNLQKAPGNELAIAQLDARFAERPRHEWLDLLQQYGVPAGPVGHRDDWFASEQVAANDMRVELAHPALGRVSVPGVSAKLQSTPGRVERLMEDALPDAIDWQSRPPWHSNGAGENRPPLSGVRILDMGNVIAGPFGPTVLANYGADVIKVEPPDGDTFRPFALGFAGWNWGKRSVVMDLKSREGLDQFLALVRTADVVVDNFRRGVNERLGIDYESLKRVNPRIICVSVMGYGPDGPFAAEPGFDPILQARSGMMSAQGGADEPVFHTIPVNDEASALMSAFATVVALHARNRTGQGQQVWTSLANQSIVCQSGEVTWYEGKPDLPLGDRDCVGVSALHRLYPCADGWVAVACSTAEHARSLLQTLEIEGFEAGAVLGESRHGALASAIGAALAGLTREDAVARLGAAGVPATIAIRSEEAYDDPWLNANGFWREFELEGHGTVLGVRAYAEFSRTPGGFALPSPELGAHTAEVLAEIGVASTAPSRP